MSRAKNEFLKMDQDCDTQVNVYVGVNKLFIRFGILNGLYDHKTNLELNSLLLNYEIQRLVVMSE